MIRIRRLLAIARQDLAVELAGRQGLLLPMVLASLLVPTSLTPSPMRRVTSGYEDRLVRVTGDVPPEVLEDKSVVTRSRYRMHFANVDGVLLVETPFIPTSIRERLDGLDPNGRAIAYEVTPRTFRFPGRTAMLALVTASTLTGAVSQSIGGERQRKTLVVLLAAAISRAEIVLGKWLAWGAFGAAASMLGAAVAILSGNAEIGSWLVPLPTVPLATVALGLYLVRRASDVLAGSATALRVLPATFSILGGVAWFVGDYNPWLGALIPLGGALLAAGQTWPELGPTLLAAASTLAFTAAALAVTIRDLEESPDRNPPEDGWILSISVALLGAVAWWLSVAGPELWRLAGNRKVTDNLPIEQGLLAGGVTFLLFSVVRAVRSQSLPIDELSLRIRRGDLGRVAVTAAVSLLLLGALSLAGPLPGWVAFGDAAMRERFMMGISGEGISLWLAALCICADELMFRGFLQRSVGPGRALLVYLFVKSPLDVLAALPIGLVCGGASAVTGNLWAGLIARLGWLVIVRVLAA